MRRRGLLRNVSIAYNGVLGVTTEKGQQDVKPNVLDAPTESYEIMLLRWQTGVFEVGAPAPVPPIPSIDPDALVSRIDGAVLRSRVDDQPLIRRIA